MNQYFLALDRKGLRSSYPLRGGTSCTLDPCYRDRKTPRMTFYEHAMLGGTLTAACGAHRRHVWAIVLMAATAAALPDWDGLSLAFGPNAYSAIHRVWGHNL